MRPAVARSGCEEVPWGEREPIAVHRDASRRGDGVRTRELLLEAGGEEFAEKGFHGTTVREIAARGGTNIAAVSYHFRGKESLFREAVAVAASRFRVTVQDALGDAPLRERIGRLFAILFVPVPDTQSLPWAHRLMLRELLRPDLRCRDTIVEFRGFLSDLLWSSEGCGKEIK